MLSIMKQRKGAPHRRRTETRDMKPLTLASIALAMAGAAALTPSSAGPGWHGGGPCGVGHCRTPHRVCDRWINYQGSPRCVVWVWQL